MELNTDIKYLKGVGEKRARLLAKLGVLDINALLRLYPRAYEDWSKITAIAKTPFGEPCCIKAIVGRKPSAHLIRKGLTIYKTEVTDGEDLLHITIFNNKYAAEKLKEGEEFLFFGKIGGNLTMREMLSPDIEKAEGGERIRPIYPQTEGISSKVIEGLVETAFEQVESKLAEPLPIKIRESYCLLNIKDSLQNIHSPESPDMLGEARRRLIFEELLVLQLGLLQLKGRSKASTGAIIEKDYCADYFKLLPFKLTSAQLRAVKEAIMDMQKPSPMNRLLQGDVGSGKTAVAAALIYSTAKNGMQSALMAPTEILAQQHYRTLTKLFVSTDITVDLLTGSTPATSKKDIKTRLRNGELKLVIGTHALIQKDVEFENLGLVVTDEQHRFGVVQRSELGGKGANPHILVMSATPIPRTLALIIYGDLDISILDELPPGRQKIATYYIGGDKRIRSYGYVKKHLDEGRQGYIVCPLVEEGETELAAAQEYAEKLSAGFFSCNTVGLLHGRLKAKEKEQVMSAFVKGEIQLLVSTTVIEVGVDVPNAVIMVIENAERFGLSQLHQLRGRIGRSEYKSTCILISDAQNDEAKRRLEVMTRTTDGFKIADEDLKLRGPGDFFGARQHGLPALKIADMMTDTELLRETQTAARAIMAVDGNLNLPENKNLKAAVAMLFETVRETGMN
ncbi:MAG: ATP-dependent DNA helicase RecG [Eubacteriales bacterium]